MSSVFLSVSRLLQVISFFLPLKILILLSSPNSIPVSFSYLPFDINHNYIMLLMFALVPITYLGYIMFGVLHRYYLDKDISMWVNSNNTVEAFKVKSKSSFEKLHGHIAKLMSEIYLLIISMLLTIIVDPYTFLFVVLLVVGNYLVFVKKVFYVKEHDRIGILRLHRKQYIEYLSSVSFIAIFAMLALQVEINNIGVFNALFLLLIGRMIFQSVQRFSMENIYIILHAK